jgi:hypothetical protein
MRNTLSRSHRRRLAPQVQRPRLRPSWRIALAIVAAAATLTLVGRAARAVGEALADRDWSEIRRDADRLIAEQRFKEERAKPTYLDPEACKLDYGVDAHPRRYAFASGGHRPKYSRASSSIAAGNGSASSPAPTHSAARTSQPSVFLRLGPAPRRGRCRSGRCHSRAR